MIPACLFFLIPLYIKKLKTQKKSYTYFLIFNILNIRKYSKTECRRGGGTTNIKGCYKKINLI